MNENLNAYNNKEANTKKNLRLIIYHHPTLGDIVLLAQKTNNPQNLGSIKGLPDPY